MASERSSSVQPLVDDLRRIFGDRLEAVAAYGWRPRVLVPTIALVESLTLDDLTGCAARSSAWRNAGLAVPLVVTRSDFARSLDAFPIEYGEIIDHHEMAYGADFFEGFSIGRDDLRRACEVQVKSHLLHLREDFMVCGGKHREVDALVRESAPAFEALLRNLARLDITRDAQASADLAEHARRRLGLDARVVGDLLALSRTEALTAVDTVKLFPEYLEVMEQLSEFVDRWPDV